MAFEELELVFRELRAEWAHNPVPNSVPLRRFLMHAYAPDHHHLKFLVTDYHSNTFETVKSIDQLEDLRDSTGIGGSWSDFVEYLMVSIKSEYTKLIFEKRLELGGTIFAKLVAQKSKGMPLISIPLSKLVDSTANDAMENMSFGLFRAFEVLLRLDGNFQSAKGLSIKKPESAKNQIETNPMVTCAGSFNKGGGVVPSQDSPDEQAAQKPASTKARQIVPGYRRAKVRGAVLHHGEDDGGSVS